MEKETVEKKSKVKPLIIILSVLVITLTSVICYFVVTDKPVSIIYKMFQSDEENSILLDEFILNLRSEGYNRNYLKIEVALMYTNKKQEKIINSSINKIRDVIITDLGEKSAKELLDKDNILNVKKEIKNDVNTALKEDIVQEVYFANMVIQ